MAMLTNEAEQLLKGLLGAKNAKKYVEKKFKNYESDEDINSHLRELLNELLDKHLIMCTWYGNTLHELKIPISAEKYFDRKAEAERKEKERLAEKARLEEEAKLFEQVKLEKEQLEREQEFLKKEEKLKKESHLREQARLDEITRLEEASRQQEEARKKEIARLQEEAKALEKARQQEMVRLQEEAKRQEEAKQREMARLQEEAKQQEEARQKEIARLQEQIRLQEIEKQKEQARLQEEARQKEELRLREAAELLKEAGLNQHIDKNDKYSFLSIICDSDSTVDISINEIKKQIDIQGGNDKPELTELLEEASEIVEEINSTRRIPKRKRFFNDLSVISDKHNWFYSAIISLIGRSGVNLLGG